MPAAGWLGHGLAGIDSTPESARGILVNANKGNAQRAFHRACPITPTNLVRQVLDIAAREILQFACPQTQGFGQSAKGLRVKG
jgi:hypothetical protein